MPFYLSFDKTVYSDAGLTNVISSGVEVKNTFTLPEDLYFGNNATSQTITGKNNLGDTLYTVTFTPDTHLTTDDEGQQIILVSAAWA